MTSGRRPASSTPPGRAAERLDQAIAVGAWLELLRSLVRTPSHPGIERQEEAVVSILRDALQAEGIAAETVEVAPGRPNLIARVEGPRPGRRLLLCGHTDTVPLNAGDPGFAFSGELRDGRVLGRGSCDMKGGLAAMFAALVSLQRTAALPAGEVVLAAVVDEEMQSLGTERLVRDGFRADGAVVGEPTANRLALGHRGLEWLEIEISGRAAHGGHPEAGVNAIVAAARFVSLVEERLLPRLAERRHPLLGPPTFNLGTIEGGDQPSTVAGTCRLAVDRRTVPGEAYAAVVEELGELLEVVRAGMPGLRWDVRRVPGGMATLEHLPSVCEADHPLARAAGSAIANAAGRTEPGTAFPAWTDAALLSNFAGIPSIVLGPGDLALAHTPRESVAVAEVELAARIYARTAVLFCAEVA